MYVDSNGDLWRVSAFIDTLSFIGFTNTQVFAYTSPDCSGPAYFMLNPNLGSPPPLYAHVVFADSTRADTVNLRVLNTNAKLTNIQIQSILDTAGSAQCSTQVFSASVLAVAETTVVTPPNIAVSMPLHPVFTP
jgi:hypothetical protein